MKILVFGASGPLGRRSTEAARTQSLNLRPRLAAATCCCTGLAEPPSLTAGTSLEATMWDHADAALIDEMIRQRSA
jgi:hypothetical protein